MRKEEHSLQCQIIEYLRIHKVFCFAVPNGGQRHVLVAKSLKAEGVLAGVSDIIILLPNKCMFIEIKVLKGKQSPSQKEFEKNVKRLGFEYYIWNKFEDAEGFITMLKWGLN